MKTSLVFKGIEVTGVKIGEVAVSHEYSATEAIQLMMGGKDFIKSFIKDIPEMASDLKKAYDVVEAINNDVVAEDIIEVADKSVIDRYIDMLNDCESKNEVDQVLTKAINDDDTSLDDITTLYHEAKRIIEEKAGSITYRYCIEAIKNTTCEAVINEVVDHARIMLNSEDYVVVVNTAIQRKQEIGVEPFM